MHLRKLIVGFAAIVMLAVSGCCHHRCCCVREPACCCCCPCETACYKPDTCSDCHPED